MKFITYLVTTTLKFLGPLLLVLTSFVNQIAIKPHPNVLVETYPQTIINSVWLNYRDKIQKDGRTIDRDRNYITTSEGQSYSLLRAVWMDDKEIFDKVLKWTNNNLERREGDNLFAWLWGQQPNGEWDILYEEGGINTATDADQDIALALIFAHQRWSEERYLSQAQKLLNDIWEQETITVNKKRYLVAGNWAKDQEFPLINPSYYTFYAYPIFAKVDPVHDWMQIKQTCYDVLAKSTLLPLDTNSSAHLPPDWISINPQTGEILPPSTADKQTHFADDAIRVIWRVTLDWQWHQDPRATNYLDHLDFLAKEWQIYHKIAAAYTHDGTALQQKESHSLYSATMGYFQAKNPQLGKEIYQAKIASLIDPDSENWREKLGYYSQNWVWFGITLYHESLPNLYQK